MDQWIQWWQVRMSLGVTAVLYLDTVWYMDIRSLWNLALAHCCCLINFWSGTGNLSLTPSSLPWLIFCEFLIEKNCNCLIQFWHHKLDAPVITQRSRQTLKNKTGNKRLRQGAFSIALPPQISVYLLGSTETPWLKPSRTPGVCGILTSPKLYMFAFYLISNTGELELS